MEKKASITGIKLVDNQSITKFQNLLMFKCSVNADKSVSIDYYDFVLILHLNWLLYSISFIFIQFNFFFIN